MRGHEKQPAPCRFSTCSCTKTLRRYLLASRSDRLTTRTCHTTRRSRRERFPGHKESHRGQHSQRDQHPRPAPHSLGNAFEVRGIVSAPREPLDAALVGRRDDGPERRDPSSEEVTSSAAGVEGGLDDTLLYGYCTRYQVPVPRAGQVLVSIRISDTGRNYSKSGNV